MKKLLLFLLVVVVLMLAGLWSFLKTSKGFSAREQPSALEAGIARRLRTLAMPPAALAAKNPVVASPEVLTEARHHFADHCATCHANDGSGNTPIGQNFYSKAPDMRRPETQSLTDGELYYIIHNGVRLTGMPAWGASDQDEGSWKLVWFIRQLPQLPPEDLRDMEKFNPRSPHEIEEEKQEEDFLNGKAPGPAGNAHHH